MANSRKCCFDLSSTLILSLVVFASTLEAVQASNNRKVGIRFLAYENSNGQLPGGACCDGNCVDSCDTVFKLCFRHKSNSSCSPDWETPTIINNNSISQFGKRFGGPGHNLTVSTLVLGVPTVEDIHIDFDVLEVDETAPKRSRQLMGNFSVTLNYTNTYSGNPDWDTYHFQKNNIRLTVNVTSFCQNHFYGKECNVSCRSVDSPYFGHFTCDNNGGHVCKPGYSGPDCKIQDCSATICKNGATCAPGSPYVKCTCTPRYTGANCESLIPTTTLASASPASGNAASAAAATTKYTSATSASSATSVTTQKSTSATTQTGVTSKFGKSQQKPGSSDSGGGSSTGIIAGSIAGILLLGVAATVVAYILLQRKRKRTISPRPDNEEKGATEDGEAAAWQEGGEFVSQAPASTNLATDAKPASLDF